MDNLETILYVIVAAIWVIYGYIKKRKNPELNSGQKTQPQIPENEPADETDIFDPEAIFEKIFTKNIEPKLHTKQVLPYPEESLETITRDQYYQKKAKEQKEIKKTTVTAQQSEIGLAEEIHNEFNSTKFDLRKAFIYQEILKKQHN